jgi:hypothetical protein
VTTVTKTRKAFNGVDVEIGCFGGWRAKKFKYKRRPDEWKGVKLKFKTEADCSEELSGRGFFNFKQRRIGLRGFL